MRDVGLVIFDCDGVLVDSEPISCGVLAQMLTSTGLPTTLSEARRDYQGLLLKDVLIQAQRRLGRELPADWIERFERNRAEAFERELSAVAGAREVVSRLRECGLGLCVASQGKLEKTFMTLTITGLIDLFDRREIFSAYCVERGKPFPDLFLHAAETMGVTPRQTVVIEDSASGVAAGVAAGMRVFGYGADADAAALSSSGARVFNELADIPTLLGLL